MADAVTADTDSLRVNRRLTFVRWVRKTHGWFGLWGAILGLIFGTAGIWLNHRLHGSICGLYLWNPWLTFS